VLQQGSCFLLDMYVRRRRGPRGNWFRILCEALVLVGGSRCDHGRPERSTGKNSSTSAPVAARATRSGGGTTPPAASGSARSGDSGTPSRVPGSRPDSEPPALLEVPESWLGSWKTSLTAYFSLLDVGGSRPVSGRSLCLTISESGTFHAVMSEYQLASGFTPCGPVKVCSLDGQLEARGPEWRLTEQTRSCKLPQNLPRSYGARIRIINGSLKLDLEDGGLFGALHDFALRRGPCAPVRHHGACPAPPGPGEPGPFMNQGY
jgi:hypothetical protein